MRKETNLREINQSDVTVLTNVKWPERTSGKLTQRINNY